MVERYINAIRTEKLIWNLLIETGIIVELISTIAVKGEYKNNNKSESMNLHDKLKNQRSN